MEKVKIGVVTKPQALKGAFRVKPEILNLKKLKKLHEIFVDNKSYTIESVTLRDTFAIFKVQDIDTCEQAENMRNKTVFAEIEIEKSNNLDLVGFDAIVDGKRGKIVDINNFGSKDIMTIEFENSCMLPIIDGLIEKVDYDSKTVTLSKQIFDQVAVVWE